MSSKVQIWVWQVWYPGTQWNRLLGIFGCSAQLKNWDHLHRSSSLGQVLLDAPCSGESLTRKEGLEMLDHPPGYVEGLRGPQPRQNPEGDPFGMGVVEQKSS
jgi:hypothetical protein